MTKQEALALCQDTTLDLGSGASWVRQLGNGEYVVVLRRRGYHLWNEADWDAYRAESRTQAQASAQPAIDTTTPYTLALPL